MLVLSFLICLIFLSLPVYAQKTQFWNSFHLETILKLDCARVMRDMHGFSANCILACAPIFTAAVLSEARAQTRKDVFWPAMLRLEPKGSCCTYELEQI
mmetsp:Transcript_71858/g.124787  ORF Transcript_71858/g.124787 Transcript_71858/m.124787 type:complete len:99 (-) Transcript_71858:54-350(-)